MPATEPGPSQTADQRVRVLHLGKYLPPHHGGIERFLAELMPALRGQQVDSAALVHGSDRKERACSYRFGAACVRAPVIASLAFTPISPSWPCRLSTLIRRWRPRLLHLHLPNPSAFWALLLPSARRLPWLVHWHADVPADAGDWRLRLLQRLYRPLETWVLRRATLIVASSEAYAASSPALRRWHDKVVTIPLGLADTGPAPPRPDLWPAPGALKLLFVGRFTYYKGIDVLLRALADTDGIDLLLIGNGALDALLRRLVVELGLEQRVRFAGAVDDDLLAATHASADVLCLPSIERSEAFGMVLLEAMRAGVATIATRVEGSGMAEVIDDGRAGMLVPPADPAALAAALTRLRDDPTFRRQLADAGRRRFAERFRITGVARSIADLYRRITT